MGRQVLVNCICDKCGIVANENLKNWAFVSISINGMRQNVKNETWYCDTCLLDKKAVLDHALKSNPIMQSK